MDARIALSDDTGSAAAARRFVRTTLSTWRLEMHTETAALLISELVTNAVLHARSAPEVVLRAEGDTLRVEVHDASPVLPSRRHYGLQAGTGRGMILVEEMASSWGADHVAGGGKVVWFELQPGSGMEAAFAEFDLASVDDSAFDDIPPLPSDAGRGSPGGSGPPGQTGWPSPGAPLRARARHGRPSRAASERALGADA